MSTKPAIFRSGQSIQPPSEIVTSLETRFIEHNVASRLRNLTLEGAQSSLMPRRGSYATVCSRKFVMYANYFHLEVTPQAKHIQVYTISGLESVSRGKRADFIKKLLNHPMLKDRLVATDFSNTLLTLDKLPLPTPRYAVKVDLLGLPEPKPDDPAELIGARSRNSKRLTIEFDCQLSLSEYQRHLNDLSTQFEKAGEVLRSLNIIIGSYPIQCGLTSLGARYFPRPNQPGILPEGQANKDFVDIGHGLLAQRGYFASVRPSTGRILVNINTTSAAFYDGRAPNLLKLFEKWAGGSPASKTYGAARSFLRNLRVETSYGDGPKIRTIVDYHPQRKTAAQVTFSHNGTAFTVQQYFQQVYNIKLNCPKAVVVNVGSTSHPVWLPMELARVLPNQRGRTMLTAEQTTNMLGFATRKPAENAQLITSNGLHMLGLNGDALQNWGLKPNLDMVTVSARLLKSPILKYGKKTIRITKPGAWNLKDVPEFVTPPSLKDITWGFVRFTVKGQKPVPALDLDTAKRDFESTLKKYKIDISSPAGTLEQSLGSLGPNVEELEVAKKAVLDAIHKASIKKLTWVLILLPDLKGSVLYDHLKKLADVDYGITTICCLKKNFVSKGVNYYANVTLKVNQKLGGVNHVLESSQVLRPLDKNTMVVGIDVTHPGPGSSPVAPSIAAVIASEDGRFAS